MSNYIITQYSYDKAKKLNLIIKPSKNKGKKIDVYTINNEFLHSKIKLLVLFLNVIAERAF